MTGPTITFAGGPAGKIWEKRFPLRAGAPGVYVSLPMATILVVDDHKDSRELLEYILADDGHEILQAENGNEAVARYRARPTDLVILDVFMPEKNGIEAMTEIRQEFPRVKIVAMTAGWNLGRRDPLMLALEAGADATIRKPIDPVALRRAVAALLAQLDSGMA